MVFMVFRFAIRILNQTFERLMEAESKLLCRGNLSKFEDDAEPQSQPQSYDTWV